jgi:hypothetical protein
MKLYSMYIFNIKIMAFEILTSENKVNLPMIHGPRILLTLSHSEHTTVWGMSLKKKDRER